MNAKGIVARIIFGISWLVLCIGFLYASKFDVAQLYFTFVGALVGSAAVCVGAVELIRWLGSADEK